MKAEVKRAAFGLAIVLVTVLLLGGVCRVLVVRVAEGRHVPERPGPAAVRP